MAELMILGLPWWFATGLLLVIGGVVAAAVYMYMQKFKGEEIFMPRAIEFKDSVESALLMKPEFISNVVLCGDATHPGKVLGKCVGFNPQPYTGNIPHKDGNDHVIQYYDDGKDKLASKKIKVLDEKQMIDRGYALINDIIFQRGTWPFTTNVIIRAFDCTIMDKEYNSITKGYDWVPSVENIEIKAVGFRKRGGFLYPNHYFDDDSLILGYAVDRTMAVTMEKFIDMFGKLTTKALRMDEEYIKRQKQKEFRLIGKKKEPVANQQQQVGQ